MAVKGREGVIPGERDPKAGLGEMLEHVQTGRKGDQERVGCLRVWGTQLQKQKNSSGLWLGPSLQMKEEPLLG